MPSKRAVNPDFRLETTHTQDGLVVNRLILSGDWRISALKGRFSAFRKTLQGLKSVEVDILGISALDTAGAFLISSTIHDRWSGKALVGNQAFIRLFDMVSPACETIVGDPKSFKPSEWSPVGSVVRLLNNLGLAIHDLWHDFFEQAIFMGQVVTASLLSLLKPSRIRLTALTAQMQAAGLEALPIIGITNIFVGAVIAFLGVLQLQQFGAAIFAIDMLGMAILREFGPVIAAVLLAGRSASSFAAEIGTMKMNQEVDAMRVLGIDPMDALILPRVFAMMIMTPLVSFIGAMCGLLGGSLIIWAVLGYSPAFFLQRLNDTVPFVNFFVGIFKTPFFAAMIAVIGCRMGMTVDDDVISLGRNVTKAVVHAIFTIFLLNAAFAMLFNGFELS